MVKSWRNLLDAWTVEHQCETKIIMTEAYTDLKSVMKYYESTQIPFNFLLITDLNRGSSATDFVAQINKWLSYMPVEGTPNWVVCMFFNYYTIIS